MYTITYWPKPTNTTNDSITASSNGALFISPAGMICWDTNTFNIWPGPKVRTCAYPFIGHFYTHRKDDKLIITPAEHTMMTLIIGDQIISETQGTITLHESGVIITPQCIEPEQLLAQIKSKLRGMFQYELVNHDDKSVGLWIKLFPDCPTIDILFSDTSEE